MVHARCIRISHDAYIVSCLTDAFVMSVLVNACSRQSYSHDHFPSNGQVERDGLVVI